MKIKQIPIYADNYGYLIIDEAQGVAAAVDPADADPVLAAISEEGVRLTHVLCTHHHWDHVGGNEVIQKAVPDVIIVGGSVDADRIPGCTVRVEHGGDVKIGSLVGKVLEVPCHTSGHVAYLFGDALFCGDTLFVGGCGRFFEGDAAQMHHALNEVFAKLPGETLVYCGHEYTVSNLEFALDVEPNNPAVLEKIEWARTRRAKGLPTVPSTIAEELTYNPFMRVDQPDVVEAVSASDPVDVMARLRQRKNEQ